jgi:competence protein ComEC
MPLIALGVAAYATGLLLGFDGGASLWVAAAGVLFATATRRAVPSGAALIGAAGVMVAGATARDDGQCLDVMRRRVEWRVVLDDSVEPGAFGSAHAVTCHTVIALSVARGTGGAGDAAIITGQRVVTARGLLVQHATVHATGRASMLTHWREAAASRVDTVFRADAPLARALLVADMHAIPRAMRDRYTASGMIHMLSGAGLHVALIVVAFRLLFGVCRFSRRRSDIATLIVTVGYVLLLGAPPAAVRSAIMLGVLVICRLTQRPTSPWAILALGALGPLTDPRAVQQVGYQLTVVGVAGLIAASTLAERIPKLRDARGATRKIAHAVLASTIATIVTAPLAAWTFGLLSTIGPVTNLVAGPVLGLLQPILFLGLLFSPIMPVARFLADAAHPLLWAFDEIATVGASIPGGSFAVAPSILTAVLGGIISGSVVAACVSRRPARPALVGLSAAALLVWAPFAPAFDGRTELHMIDVGQGDAIALRTRRGHWVLVDAGRVWPTGDAGRATIVPYLAHRGGALTAFVLTHPHDDHVGGAATVIHALRPIYYYDAAYVNAGSAYRASLLEARRDAVAWRRVHPGDSLVVDEATITFLGPDSAWTSRLRDANAASAIALIRVDSVRMLLVGDAERGEEDWLLQRNAAALRADVLKVGHHGSATSTTSPFLDAVAPRIALVSVGAGNKYGHPSADVMHRLAGAGALVLRTDRLSSVILRTDGRTIEIEANGDRWILPRSR